MNSERQRRQRLEAERRVRERERRRDQRRFNRVDSSDWIEMILGPRRGSSRRQVSPLVYQGFRYGLILLYLGTLLIVIGYHNPWVGFVRIVGLAMVAIGAFAVIASVGHTAVKYSSLARLWNGSRVGTEEGLSSVSGRVDSAASKASLPTYEAVVNADLPTYDEAILLDPQALFKAVAIMDSANCVEASTTPSPPSTSTTPITPSTSTTPITPSTAGTMTTPSTSTTVTARRSASTARMRSTTSSTEVSSTSAASTASALRSHPEFIAEIELNDRRLESGVRRSHTALSSRLATFSRSYSSSSSETEDNDDVKDNDKWSMDNVSVVNNVDTSDNSRTGRLDNDSDICSGEEKMFEQMDDSKLRTVSFFTNTLDTGSMQPIPVTNLAPGISQTQLNL